MFSAAGILPVTSYHHAYSLAGLYDPASQADFGARHRGLDKIFIVIIIVRLVEEKLAILKSSYSRYAFGSVSLL